jgi:hypothetical protein
LQVENLQILTAQKLLIALIIIKVENFGASFKLVLLSCSLSQFSNQFAS